MSCSVFGGVDLILSDQRRAFSDTYMNYELMKCGCYAELSVNNPLSKQEYVQIEELKRTPCILITSREQQNAEQEYYQKFANILHKLMTGEKLNRIFEKQAAGKAVCFSHKLC